MLSTWRTLPGAILMRPLGFTPGCERQRLRLAGVSRVLHDRRNLGIAYEALPALLVPVEDRPHPVRRGGIPEDQRSPGPVQLPLRGAAGGEDLQELVEIRDRRRCEQHGFLPVKVEPAVSP